VTVSTAYDPSNPIRVTVSGGVGPAGAAGAAGAVFSVNGLTGTITLSSIPATFTPGTHTHDASAIQAGTMATARLPIATATAVGVVSVTSGLSVTAGGALSANVRSVAGRTGDIVITAADVTAVQTVNGKAGTALTITHTDVTAQKVITSGTAAPTGGSDGDIYLRYT